MLPMREDRRRPERRLRRHQQRRPLGRARPYPRLRARPRAPPAARPAFPALPTAAGATAGLAASLLSDAVCSADLSAIMWVSMSSSGDSELLMIECYVNLAPWLRRVTLKTKDHALSTRMAFSNNHCFCLCLLANQYMH